MKLSIRFVGRIAISMALALCAVSLGGCEIPNCSQCHNFASTPTTTH
jgi:hypothetical protein